MRILFPQKDLGLVKSIKRQNLTLIRANSVIKLLWVCVCVWFFFSFWVGGEKRREGAVT